MSFFYRILDKVEILQLGERQLSIIKDFVKYCRMKLKKERINFFVEPNKALSASQILCMTANGILEEVEESELKLKELEAVIVMVHINEYITLILRVSENKWNTCRWVEQVKTLGSSSRLSLFDGIRSEKSHAQNSCEIY